MRLRAGHTSGAVDWELRKGRQGLRRELQQEHHKEQLVRLQEERALRTQWPPVLPGQVEKRERTAAAGMVPLVAGRMGCMPAAAGAVDMAGHTAAEEEHTRSAAAHRVHLRRCGGCGGAPRRHPTALAILTVRDLSPSWMR